MGLRETAALLMNLYTIPEIEGGINGLGSCFLFYYFSYLQLYAEETLRQMCKRR